MDVLVRNRIARTLVLGVSALLATACHQNMMPLEPVPVAPVVVEKHHHHHHHACKHNCGHKKHAKKHHRAHHKAHHKTHAKNDMSQADMNQASSASTSTDGQNVAPAQ
jgi:hypothetical protein